MIDRNDSGPALPSSIIRDAISLIGPAWAMFRSYTASGALFEQLERK